MDDPAEIERRLDAGEWLGPSAVAKLLGVSRTTVHRLFEDEKLAYRTTPGGQRRADPADVRRMLEQTRTVHRGKGEEPPQA